MHSCLKRPDLILTGNCQQIVDGVIRGSAYGLAICHYDGEAGYYLFGCDSNWNAVTDTFHETIEQAQAQAEFEYQGVTATWQKVQKGLLLRGAPSNGPFQRHS